MAGRISGAGRMQMAVLARLTRARVASGKTQEQIAAKVGVTRQAIAAWEAGASLPNGSNLFLWAAALNLRIVVENEPTQP
jgi:transcriptional regulator with XRE-family HTH domain